LTDNVTKLNTIKTNNNTQNINKKLLTYEQTEPHETKAWFGGFL